MSNQNIVDRLSNALNCITDKELSDFLDVKRTTLSSWRSKSSIPIDKLVEIAQKHGLSLDFLVLGKLNHASIDNNLMEEIAREFEMSYKATVEKDETAFWITYHELFPEEAKGRPFDEDIEQVMDAVNKRGRIARLISNIYNKSIEKQDKELRAAFVSNMITASISFFDRPTDMDPEEFANEVESINIKNAEKRTTSE